MKASNPDKKPVRRSTDREMVSDTPKFKFMWFGAISDLNNNKGNINTSQGANQPQYFFSVNSFQNLMAAVNQVAKNFPEGPPPSKFVNHEGVLGQIFTKVLK